MEKSKRDTIVNTVLFLFNKESDKANLKYMQKNSELKFLKYHVNKSLLSFTSNPITLMGEMAPPPKTSTFLNILKIVNDNFSNETSSKLKNIINDDDVYTMLGTLFYFNSFHTFSKTMNDKSHTDLLLIDAPEKNIETDKEEFLYKGKVYKYEPVYLDLKEDNIKDVIKLVNIVCNEILSNEDEQNLFNKKIDIDENLLATYVYNVIKNGIHTPRKRSPLRMIQNLIPLVLYCYKILLFAHESHFEILDKKLASIPEEKQPVNDGIVWPNLGYPFIGAY